jgi:hypothetical protein
MTKRDLAKKIISGVENSMFLNMDQNETLDVILAALSTLAPIDRKKFAAWGTPDEQSTPEKCWED